MQHLVDGLVLYHGSYTEVREPDLSKCAKYKDFGQGFYLTSSFDQACSFAKLTLRKSRTNNIARPDDKPTVSRFSFRTAGQPIDVQSFETANEEWLHCVVAHRKKGLFPASLAAFAHCDVIVGKIANDQTNATITTYMAEAFGTPGTAQADQICMSLLLPERLTDQFCFRTDNALSHLRFEGSEHL